MKVDVPFGVDTRVRLARFDFDGAVDVVVLKGFIKVAPIAEDSTGCVSAVNVALLWVVRVGEEVHGCSLGGCGWSQCMRSEYVAVLFCKKSV